MFTADFGPVAIGKTPPKVNLFKWFFPVGEAAITDSCPCFFAASVPLKYIKSGLEAGE